MTPTGGGYGGAGVPFLRIGRIQMPSFWRMCVEVLGRGHAGQVKYWWRSALGGGGLDFCRGLAEFLMIVLVDDANLSSLDDSVDDITGLSPNKEKYPQSNLEELRHLPVKTQEQSQIVIKDLRGEVVDKSAPKVGFKEKGSKNRESIIGSLYVDRTKDWIVKTSAHVDKLLSATFPHLCVHPAKKLRQGLLAAIEGLLSKCCYTLKESKLMLLQMSANGHSRRVLLQFFHPQVRSRRSTTEEYDPEVSGRLSGTVRRHIPMDLSITIIGRKWITGMRNVHHGLDSSNQTGPLSIFG